MVKACLTGPATQAEIDAFLAGYTPSASLRSPRNFVCQCDAVVEIPADIDSFNGEYDEFRTEAVAYEHGMTRQCEVIAAHAPTRGTKSLGLQSQKQLREMEHAKFKHNISVLARKHGVLSGAWMAYLDEDDIDTAWRRVVEELASPNGRLAAAGATYARVTSKRQSDRMPWVLWVYVPDAYDCAAVETVDRVLVERCGYAPTAFKTDAMSILGITGKHPSKIAPSLYGTLAFMTREEITAAKERYATHGPATSISPLSGPPFEQPIDWDYVYVPPGEEGSAQPVLALGPSPSQQTTPAASSAAAAAGAKTKTKPPVAPQKRKTSSTTSASGGSKKKARQGLFNPSSSDEEDDQDAVKYADRGGPASPSSRPTRRAVQKARERWAPEQKEEVGKAHVIEAQAIKAEEGAESAELLAGDEDFKPDVGVKAEA